MSVLIDRDSQSSDSGPEDSETTSQDAPQALVSHLEDLRSCIVRAAVGLIAGTGVAYALFPRILDVLMRPPIDKLVYTSPMEPFFAQCKVSIAIGFLLSFPWVLYQAWRFVAPALKPKERRVLLRMIPASYALFLIGSALGLFVAVPIGLKFLLSYSTSRLMPYITLNSYLTYLTYMTLGLGVLFQLPLILFILCALGILSPDTLAKYRRHVFLGILIVGAAITPSPDVYGQLIIAIPTYLLYELALLAVRLSGSRAAGDVPTSQP